jgi:hypothetical protein
MTLADLHQMLAKMHRATDAVRLNEIVNNETVRPFVRGAPGPLDLSQVVADQNNVVLVGEHGAIVFQHHQPGLFEAHSQCLPEGRGAWMVLFTRACIHWMMTRVFAVDLMTRVPRGNVAAKVLTKMVGGEFEFTDHHDVWNGKPVPADIFSITIQHWLRDAPWIEERGEWFAKKFGAECARFDYKPKGYPAESPLKRHLGAAFEMLTNGQVEKAVIFYNRFASLAHELPMAVRLLKPLSIDLGKANIVVRADNDFFVTFIFDERAPMAAEG